MDNNYANCSSTAADVEATKRILFNFGQAAGLHANLNKSSIMPIQCQDVDTVALADMLGCKHAQFPCTYLGMPLSDKRLCKGDFQPALDKLAGKAKGWKRGHFSLDARLILVKHVLSAMVVFQMIAIEAPIWLTKAADKIRRGFLWAKEDVATGGRCLVNWKAVCRPLELGGLGLPDLQARGLALRVRWLWQSWSDEHKPWQGLPLPIDNRVRDIFNASVNFNLGNGETIKFWNDPWLHGECLKNTAPLLFQACTRRNITVAQALTASRWTRHFRHELEPAELIQAVQLWDSLQHIHLQSEIKDTVTWRWNSSGVYTASSAYLMQFQGALKTNFREVIWASDAPLRCRIFAWLAIKGRCNTADVLAKKGWPHEDSCVFCPSTPETADHLLAHCPFITQLWAQLLPVANRPPCFMPQQGQTLLEWLTQTRNFTEKLRRKEWTAVVQLVWWSTWKERNARIFNRHAKNLNELKIDILQEASQWRLAGRPRAAALLQRPREPD